MAERGGVLDALERLLDNAREGRGGALFVVGPAGLGKTTVLEHAITVARPRFAVGVGRGDQVEAVLPFGLLGQALDQLLDGKLPGGGVALDADGGEAADISAQARFYGILRGVREAAVRPLLVALDDLHWSDPDSLTVIHLICRRLASLPVALIATARPWPAEAVTSAQDLAAHLAGDPEAVATVARAGRAALRVGVVRAARQHLEAGMRLAGETAPAELLFDLGAALVAGGASEEAIAIYERLLHLPELSTADRIAVLRELGQASFVTGQVERAAACYESAVALGEQKHSALAIGALLDQAYQHQILSGPRAALPWANRAAELATANGVMQASAQAAWGVVAYRCGDPDGLVAAATAATTRVDLIPTSRSIDRHRYRHPALSYATVAVQAERFTDAERLLTEILGSAERRCEPVTLVQAAIAWIDGLCRLGRLNEALTLVDRLSELAELLPPYLSPLAITYRALVFLEQGQLEQAALCCARLATPQIHHDRYSLHRTDGLELHVRGVLAYRQGDAETACSLFAQLQEWADRTGEVDPSYLPWAADAIAAHLACGRNTDARYVIDWVAQRAVALPSRWPKIVVATGQAALAERTGDRALAQTYFTQALDLCNELPMPLARAQTLTDYGAFLTRGGEITRARVLLAEALHLAETCGAGWHANRARAEWRRAGGRTRARKPDELSPQEATIAQLAGAGRTNREIAQQLHLSVKAVETHLGHIYQKLGIRSRWQLIGRASANTNE